MTTNKSVGLRMRHRKERPTAVM